MGNNTELRDKLARKEVTHKEKLSFIAGWDQCNDYYAEYDKDLNAKLRSVEQERQMLEKEVRQLRETIKVLNGEIDDLKEHRQSVYDVYVKPLDEYQKQTNMKLGISVIGETIRRAKAFDEIIKTIKQWDETITKILK